MQKHATGKTPGGAGVTPSTGANAVDIMTFLFFDEDMYIYINLLKEFSYIKMLYKWQEKPLLSLLLMKQFGAGTNVSADLPGMQKIDEVDMSSSQWI